MCFGRRWFIVGLALCGLLGGIQALNHSLLMSTSVSVYAILHQKPQVTAVVPGQIVHLIMEVHNSGNGLPPVELREEWTQVGPDDGKQLRGSYTILRQRLDTRLRDGTGVYEVWSPATYTPPRVYDSLHRHLDIYTASLSSIAHCSGRLCIGLSHIQSMYALPAPYNQRLAGWKAASEMPKGELVHKLADTIIRGVPVYVLRASREGHTYTLWVAKDTSLVRQNEEDQVHTGKPRGSQITTVLTSEVLTLAKVPANIFNPSIPAGVTTAYHRL